MAHAIRRKLTMGVKNRIEKPIIQLKHSFEGKPQNEKEITYKKIHPSKA
jgi:hypothetical protein